VLRLVGMSLKQTIKGQDITHAMAARNSLWCLPTPRCAALTVADHIRRAVMARN